ncbi:uncharacterized protein LOC117109816 [Anneissia japonica]|uniref:uncharacterized protein LOC117109816 n=1 Tax=Anneissia japonica TaxID=1529436 RepID=UPI001425A21B|nr:uncharacterized protein LOC117109816 [Anneissia japonica]XP_033108139.1 uncharacterized protein LOC117109816 [Anneissia japonica]
MYKMCVPGFIVLCVFYPCIVFSNFIAHEKPKSVTVVEGETAVFHCHITAQVRESYDIAWFSESRNAFLSKNGLMRHQLSTDTKVRYSITRSLAHKFDLKIDNVKVGDAGKFFCMYASQDSPLQIGYYNTVGPPAELFVLVPPTDSSPKCMINYLSHGDVDFVCASEGGTPTPLLELYMGDIRLQPEPDSTDHLVYARIRLTEKQRGVYFKCVLNSQALQKSKSCSLIPLPPIVQLTPERGIVIENGSITFNCSSYGLDNPKYEWKVTPNLILRLPFSSELELGIFTIHGAHLSDNGSKIMCVATEVNGDMIVSEEATMIVEERVITTQRTTQRTTTIEPTTELMFIPLKPKAKPNAAIDFFQNNVLILAVCVAGLFIAFLSMIAIVIICKRKRKSYDVNTKVDEVLVDKTYTPYESVDQKILLNANLFSEMDKTNGHTKQNSENGSPVVSPAESPTRSLPPSSKRSPTFTSKPSPCQSVEQSPCTSPTILGSSSTSKQSTPLYAKPMKGVNQLKSNAHHKPPTYAVLQKRTYAFHLSLEDITGTRPSDDPHSSTDDTSWSRNNHGNEYAELTDVIPTKYIDNGKKYEEISPTNHVDPTKLNVEGLKYADLEINKHCTSEIRSDSSMKTQYAEIATHCDAI